MSSARPLGSYALHLWAVTLFKANPYIHEVCFSKGADQAKLPRRLCSIQSAGSIYPWQLSPLSLAMETDNTIPFACCTLLTNTQFLNHLLK